MSILKSIKHKWEKLLDSTRGRKCHVWLFPSYWHSKFHCGSGSAMNQSNYFTACPNRGAGIGHQMSNWHSGYWWAHYFGLNFAHTSFAQSSWERFLGYGVGEKTVAALKKEGYKVVRIPLFNENSPSDMELIKNIINSYSGSKVIFHAEQDQPYHDQIGVMPDIRRKFHSAVARKSDLTPYSDSNFNIAVHVRRGDIVIGQTNKDPNLLMRWLDNNYFENVLEQVMKRLKVNKPVHIYIFSQGREEDFASFMRFGNVHFYLDLNPESTFLSLVYADLLITSKSSFSYKPAMLNLRGIKVCPANFWHSYPDAPDWILADDRGFVPDNQIIKLDSAKV